jgi:hypothetical protein
MRRDLRAQHAPRPPSPIRRADSQGILLIYTGASILIAGGMGFAFTDKSRAARIP